MGSHIWQAGCPNINKLNSQYAKPVRNVRITLRQLEVFDAIVRTGSVVRAAAEVGLSQSAASLSLRELERGLGAPLFQRDGKKLRINEHGARLRERANSLLRQIGEIESLVDSDTMQGTLRVGASATISDYILPPLCARFLSAHPGVHIELSIDTPTGVMDALEHMSIDLGFIESACHRHTLAVEPWIQDSLCIFCAPGHPLAARQAIAVRELANETWYMHPVNHPARTYSVTAIGEYLTSLKIGFVTESVEAIKRAVASGSAIGCLSRLVLQPELDSGVLKELRVPELRLVRGFSIIARRDSYRSELQGWFMRFVVESTAQRAARPRALKKSSPRRRGPRLEN
jgi:DNA-binding transcriptional LysR family regulator